MTRKRRQAGNTRALAGAAREPEALPPPPPERPPEAHAPASRRVLTLPLAFTVALAAFGLMPSARDNPDLQWSFFGAAGVLLAWNALLLASAWRRQRPLAFHVVVRRPHWMQPLVQLTIYAYWGWYWPKVYECAPLMLSMLIFAYAFDLLLGWTRRDTVELGFGPFPIIGSMGFFLLFKPEYFYWQFALIALGFAAKEFFRWERDGRSVHIFNPSSFPLAVAAVLLLITRTTGYTLGNEIAIALEIPPHIFELVFLLGLPAQLLFGVTTMTMPAMITTFGLTLLYYAITGTWFFFANIPLPVFFGMLLLVTDPATAPRSELARILYGALYGASAVAVYGLLDLLGQPTFYDKLLMVPLLNLSVRALDRWATTTALARLDPGRLLGRLGGRKRNLAWMVIWAVVFLSIDAAEGVGDTHPGNRLPFWRQACEEQRRNACRNLVIMESNFCTYGSGWACNEMGILAAEGQVPGMERFPAEMSFQRACELEFPAGCDNGRSLALRSKNLRHAAPTPDDYLLMLEPKSRRAQMTNLDVWETACKQGWGEACMKLGRVFLQGAGVQRDVSRGRGYLARACRLGTRDACGGH